MLRLIIALGVAFMLLPENHKPLETDSTAAPGPQTSAVQVDTFETLSAVNAVYEDMKQFCDRNQEACVTGQAILSQLGTQARKGIKDFSVFLHEQTAEEIDASSTGSCSF